MNKKEFLGYLTLVLSTTLIVIGLYSLYLVQYIDKELDGSFYDNAFYYITKGPMALAFILTIALAILGIFSIIKSKKEK